ncbi:hypothetical protein BH11PLA2_BH11PLA2_41480 [soil metagenome]
MRTLFGILFLSSFALAMPPVPRIIIPGEPDEASKAETVTDPTKLAERIAKNSTEAGKKLAAENTGRDTRQDQAQVKDDLDALIKLLENPPPCPNPMSGGSPPPIPPPMGGDSKGQPPPMGGDSKGQQPPPMGGDSNGQQPPPMGRDSNGQPPQPMGGNKSANGKPLPKPPGKTGEQPVKPMNEPGFPGGSAKAGGAMKPSLPLEESIARDFWGHLPDAPRQQMMQFFREQYVTKYKDLLGDYYQSLAEKEKKPTR